MDVLTPPLHPPSTRFNSYPEVTRMELYQFLMRRSLEDCDKATESTLLWMRARAAYQLAMEAKKADKTEEYLRRVTEAVRPS